MNELIKKRFFKLICGAGNKNLQEIEKLLNMYYNVGCRFFDIAADEKVLQTSKRIFENKPDAKICISIGTKEDKHFSKVEIDKNFCQKCKLCENICPQDAIKNFEVTKNNCIGCQKCLKVCTHNAINLYQEENSLQESIKLAKKYDVDCIELHASGKNDKEVLEIWNELNTKYTGFLSLSINREFLSDNDFINRIKTLVSTRKPYTTMIQADGIPMSGDNDEEKTTLPAIETGKIVQSLNLPIILVLSGGTNSKTAQIAKKENLNFNSIAFGSYARKIVKNEADFCRMQKSASKLVSTVQSL